MEIIIKIKQLVLALIIGGLIFQVGCASNPSNQNDASKLHENDSATINENKSSDGDNSLLEDVAEGAGAGAVTGAYLGTGCIDICADPMSCTFALVMTPICMGVFAVGGTAVGAVAGIVNHNTNETKIVEMPGSSNTIPPTQSYIWHYGWVPDIGDDSYGYVKKIKGEEYEPTIVSGKATEISKGRYDVSISLIHKNKCFKLFKNECEVTLETFNLALTAEEDRIYIPFADDKCDQNWAWIEEYGLASENGSPTFERFGNTSLTPPSWRAKDEATMNIVAGEKPPDKCA